MRGRVYKLGLFIWNVVAILAFTHCSISDPCIGSRTGGIARLNIVKGLDTEFGGLGAAYASFPEKTPARASFVFPDGTILLAGSAGKSLYLAHFDKEGRAATFLPTKVIALDFVPDHLAFQSTGNLLVAGINRDNSTAKILRITTASEIDSAFLISVPVPSDYVFRALAIRSDNTFAMVSTAFTPLRIQVAGFDIVLPLRFTTALLIAKFLANGAPDTSFGANGSTSIGNFQALTLLDSIDAAAFDPAGQIYLAGDAFDVQKPGEHLALARLTSNGQIDYSFGVAGRALIFTGINQSEALSLLVQPDGKPVAAGQLTFVDHVETLLVRFLTDGTPDPGFGTDGVVKETVVKGDVAPSSLLLAPIGRIVLAGYRRVQAPLTSIDPVSCSPVDPSVGRSAFFITRYDANGSRDKTFGDSGQILASFNAKHAIAHSLVAQPDGKIVAAGEADGDFAAARINP